MLQLFYINLIVLTTLESLFLTNIYIYMFYSSSLLGNEVLKKNVWALPFTLILKKKKNHHKYIPIQGPPSIIKVSRKSQAS